MTQSSCTKMTISQLLLDVANSNFVDRKSTCHFIIKFSLLLSIRLCWREIRPDAGQTTEISSLQISSEMTTQKNGFGLNSCAADKQACVFGSCAFNRQSVFKIFMTNGLNFRTVQFTKL